MPIFDVLAPKESQFFSDLIQTAQETIAENLNVLLSQTVITARLSLDFNTVTDIFANFKQPFIRITSTWEGDISGESSILFRAEDAKAMCGLLMMEPINAVKEAMKEPLGDEDMETFTEIGNQVNGSLDGGLRKNLKFDFHLKFKEIALFDASDAAFDLAAALPEEGYIFSRADLQVASLNKSYFLHVFPLDLIKGIAAIQLKEMAAEESQREEGNLQTVLIIDTDEISRKMLKKYFKDENYATVDAKDGMEALALLRKQTVDIVITELMMPNMDGMQICKRIKTNPNTRNIPVLFCSAKSTRENVTRAVQSGGEDFFVKPFTKEMIVERVSNRLKKAT